MAEQVRKFRTDASLEAERIARDAVCHFLKQRGFADVTEQLTFHGTAITQVVSARDSAGGAPLKMHVCLCWRREGRSPREREYAAAQLRARLVKDSWDETLSLIVERDRRDGKLSP